MNTIEITLENPNKKIVLDSFDTFSISYYGIKVDFINKMSDGFLLQLCSDKSTDKIFNFFLILHKMLFFNYGYFFLSLLLLKIMRKVIIRNIVTWTI